MTEKQKIRLQKWEQTRSNNLSTLAFVLKVSAQWATFFTLWMALMSFVLKGTVGNWLDVTSILINAAGGLFFGISMLVVNDVFYEIKVNKLRKDEVEDNRQFNPSPTKLNLRK